MLILHVLMLMTVLGLVGNDPAGLVAAEHAGEGSRIIASVGMPGVTKCVSVEGRYAYVGYRGGIEIFDVADPSNPLPIETLDIGGDGGYVNEIRIDGDRAYVSASFSGVFVLDLTSPEHPVILSRLDNLGEVIGVDVHGDRLYVSATGRGLLTFDVDESGNLSLVDQRRVSLSGQSGPTVNAMFVQRVGRSIYVSGRRMGLAIFEPLENNHLRDVSVTKTADEAFGFEIVGTTAYICDQDTGFTTIDVSSPRWPRYLATLELPGFAYDVDVEGTRAYVASTEGGIHVIDVYDPAAPMLIEQVDGFEWAIDIDVVGRYGYVADGRGGVKVIEFARD